MTAISVIVPLFNERENVVELHRQLREALPPQKYDAEFLLIDDGSTDGTREELAP